MYSPTTRILTVLELLQSQASLSGTALSRRLEVDSRTIRRYIVRLQEMGIPVEAEHGPQGGYRLRRGFKLPPLMFTDGEAVALTLGLMAIRDLQLPVDNTSVVGALAKTERVMPEALLAQARALQEAITFHLERTPVATRPEFVTGLSLAVQQRRQVKLSYQAWRAEISERVFEPYGIIVLEGYWYTVGYCRLRQGLRTFRLDRVQALELSETEFSRPDDFDCLNYLIEGLIRGSGQDSVEVLIRAPRSVVESKLWCCQGFLEEVPEGVIYRRSAYHLEWVALFLMSLDVPIEVRQTPALRDLIRQKAQAALQMIGEA